MTIQEAKEKYLNKVVLHKEKPYMYEVWMVNQLGSWSNNQLQFLFKHMHYDKIPMGHPNQATLEEIETEYRIIG
jgi:hypothetical protein